MTKITPEYEPERIPIVWSDIIDLLESGRVRPVIYPEVYPLERLADGLAAIESRKTWGKAVVRVREPDDASVGPARAKL